jgi:hypothetical protein
MRNLTLIAATALGGCTTTAAGLSQTSVEKTFQSAKSAAVLATCVAENSSGVVDLRDDGTRYWVIVSASGIPRTRWDFMPSGTGSVAELRTTALIGKQWAAIEPCL